MDRRIDSDEALPWLREGELHQLPYWIPPTLVNHVSESSYPRNQDSGGLAEWELPQFPPAYEQQDVFNLNGVTQFGAVDQLGGSFAYNCINDGNWGLGQSMANGMANVYPQALYNQNVGWNDCYQSLNEKTGWDSFTLAELQARMNTTSVPMTNQNPDLYTRTIGEPSLVTGFQANSWRGVNLDKSSHEQAQSISSDLFCDNFSFPAAESDGFHIPYDLNVHPTMEGDTTFNIATCCPLISATPAPAKELASSNIASISNVRAEKTGNGKNDKHKEFVTLLEYEREQRNCGDLLHDILGSTTSVSAAVVQPNGHEKGIDLNKTPQKQTQKRKKHRPKVIIDDKAHNTPKFATMKPKDVKEKSIGKGKNVQREGLQDSSEQKEEVSAAANTELIIDAKGKGRYVQLLESASSGDISKAGTAEKSCRRALAFGSEITIDNKQSNADSQLETRKRKIEGLNLNVSLQASEISGEAHKISVLESSNTATCSISTSTNQISNNLAAGSQLPSAMYERRGDLYMSRRYTGMSMPQQFHVGTEQLLCSNTRQSEQNSSFLLAEGRGLKRQHDRIEQLTPRTRTVKPSVLHQSVIQDDYYQRCGGNSRTSTCLSENHKKKKIEGIQYGALSCNAETRGPQQEANRMNAADPFQYTSRRILELLAFFSRNHPSKGSCDFQTHLMNSTRHLPNHRSSEPDLSKEKIGERNRSTTGNLETLPSTPLKSHQRSQPMFGNVTSPSSYVSSENTRLSEKQNSRKEKRQRSTKGRDKLKVMETDRSLSFQSHAAQKTTQELLEEIFDLMERLNLNCGLREGEQNALVPYKEDRAIVPYSDSEFIKRLKPRPKVDLDQETERVWKLLMWKEGSDDIEGTDKEKEKWWEEERGVFRGRAESFIARMRLVQGDRRFSKWKGSVVDSVIGVFLTQNVSDHLSSSAFMSLAALFPPNSMRNRTPTGDSTSMPLNELGINTQNCNNIRWHEKHKTFYDRSSSKLHESSEFVSHCEPSLRDTNNRAAHSHYLAEQVLPSQESISSSIGESNHAFRSYSASNPEAEDPTYAYKASKCQGSYFSDLHRQRMRMEDLTYLKGSSIFHQHINQKDPQISIPVIPSRNQLMHNTEQTKVQEVAPREFHDEESIPTSLATAILLGKINGTSWTSLRTSPGIDTVNNSASKHHVLAMPQGILPSQSDISAKQTWSELSTLHASHSAQLYERNNGFLSKITSVTQPSILAGQVDITLNSSRSHSSPVPKLVGKPFDVEERVDLAYNQKDAAIKLVMSSSGKQQVSKETKANTIKEGKRNTSKEKEAVDWDSLRKSVEANGKSERSQDTMDSMDYDAMRHTSVNKISEAIKERGMNNMLAERIKEFLDRLVRDHGSTDLEWLRHVPPEKAKEYLLSIRGLGLKSVECVRLLTLHHLAFPVDTNVGRIAVRLGWVPLQPLPESLQIHLLERYPVLESVQKYLWPRLCKLDQRTLYELHYQMITFGKVFCTKSKPNCNACPLRAECRHFASAFASARLALPCPEEKTTVTSITPLNDTNLGVVIDPMPLPSPRDNSLARVEIGISSCVPIVEEPVTPEIENVDVSLSDIEDAFSEDPDEIPTINLNMKEFSAHLQEYMNENMELQDDDMSKALVALNQQAISIPTTKLKNVSRLRTEHQVYEIPDGHPLLEGMDKREPDDPSPYLLAIWSPGETANSVELPERQCQSQEADECCDNATCFACNGRREAITQTVRGTLLIPCRTAMRGSFPLNGTYFQVNEVFADHKSSLEPIDVPRQWIWNLPRRIVYFGTSVSAIFRGLSTEKIQYCFWKGFVCVRGFDQKYRAPRPLQKRLHLSASKLAKTKSERT